MSLPTKERKRKRDEKRKKKKGPYIYLEFKLFPIKINH